MSSHSPSQVIEQFSWLPVIDRATFNNASSRRQSTSNNLSAQSDPTQQGSYPGTLQPDMGYGTPEMNTEAVLAAYSWLPSLDRAPSNVTTRESGTHNISVPGEHSLSARQDPPHLGRLPCSGDTNDNALPNESLLRCGHQQDQAHPKLDGKYLELFRYIYKAQTGKETLDWDVFLLTNRSYTERVSTNLANWFIRAEAQDKALAFSSVCRVVIFQTHDWGQCPDFKDRLKDRETRGNGLFNNTSTLEECFRAVRDLPAKDWVHGRPEFMQ